MKKKSPTTIHLFDLNEDGDSYQYDRQSGELNEILKDLIANNDFSITLQFRPIGNAFEMTGSIRAEMDLECSLCAIDLKYPVNEKVQEIIVIEKALS